MIRLGLFMVEFFFFLYLICVVIKVVFLDCEDLLFLIVVMLFVENVFIRFGKKFIDEFFF